MAEKIVAILVEQNNGNPFAVAEKISNDYDLGVITRTEAFDMMDALTKYF